MIICARALCIQPNGETTVLLEVDGVAVVLDVVVWVWPVRVDAPFAGVPQYFG